MGFIDKNLLPDEEIIFRTKKHKIIFLGPFLLMLVAFFAVYITSHTPYLTKLFWVVPVAALLYFCQVYLEYKTSDYAVTNKRVMLREGFFVRHTNEVRLSAVARVEVDQSLLGRLFNYGLISLNSFGSNMDAFPLIAFPYDFQKWVNLQLDKLVR